LPDGDPPTKASPRIAIPSDGAKASEFCNFGSPCGAQAETALRVLAEKRAIGLAGFGVDALA
jgi:hypothetical protein